MSTLPRNARGRHARRHLRRSSRRHTGARWTPSRSTARWRCPKPRRSARPRPPRTRPAQPARLLALERAGHLRVARTIADLDAGDGPPVAVLSLEGAEAIDTDLEALDQWYAAGLRCLGRSGAAPTTSPAGVAVPVPVLTRHGQRADDRGPRARAPLRRARDPRRPQPPQRGRLLGRRRPGCRPARGASHSGRARDLLGVAEPDRPAAGCDRPPAGDLWASCSRWSSCGRTSPRTPTRRSRRLSDHARYVRDRIGIEHVALGSDFDGFCHDPGAARRTPRSPRLLDALRAGGFSDGDIDAIAWTNWRRVLDAWWR